MKTDLKNAERKLDIFIREIVLILACIVLFPFKSIRVLAFKWHLWIQKWEAEIRKDHEDYLNIFKSDE